MPFSVRTFSIRSLDAGAVLRPISASCDLRRVCARWFAPSILDRREEDYLLNPKGLRSPYMMITFDSTPLGADELSAACHPYDGTLRPQILGRSYNPDYYALIEEFERLTGIGGVLNTSFNLHGEPIVSSPEDAIHTFENSGLMHLALGQYLISKKPA